MTNVGIVHPAPGYHKALRELTRKFGALLIIDETHTICAGPGGYTRAEDLEPDFLVFGKPIGGGVPGARTASAKKSRKASGKNRVWKIATPVGSEARWPPMRCLWLPCAPV